MTHITSYHTDSHQSRPRSAQASLLKEVGSPGPSAPPIPWYAAPVRRQESEAARPPDPTQAWRAAASRSETTLAPAPAGVSPRPSSPCQGSPPPQRSPRLCLRQTAQQRVPDRAPTGGRDSSPGVPTCPGPYLNKQRHLRPTVLTVAVAAVTAWSTVTPLLKTTTCLQAFAAGRRRPAGRRSACRDS